MSLLEDVATVKRDHVKAFRELALKHSIGILYGYFSKTKFEFDDVEKVIGRTLKAWSLDWTDSEKLIIIKSAVDKAFGALNTVQHYTIPYYNPTVVDINIEPLGLQDKMLKPGEICLIPLHYTTGGKHSSLNCVAPQLKKVPEEPKEGLLDLKPQTHIEWVSYVMWQPSECCNKFSVWINGCISCSKCRKPCWKPC